MDTNANQSMLQRPPEWGKLLSTYSDYASELRLDSLTRLPYTDQYRADDTVLVKWQLTPLENVSGLLLNLNLKGQLIVACERCKSMIQHDVEESILIAFVKYFDEDASLIYEADEVIEASEVESMQQVVEDTLLLALPVSPICTKEACKPIVKQYGVIQEEHPFAKLASVLQKEHKS